MKMEDGFVYMTREEIAEHNAYQRLKLALATYGPLTAKQMSYLMVGGTIGERILSVNRKMYELRKRGEAVYVNRKWRLV